MDLFKNNQTVHLFIALFIKALKVFTLGLLDNAEVTGLLTGALQVALWLPLFPSIPQHCHMVRSTSGAF